MNRPRRKRELEVRVMFEPNRFKQYLMVAYERAVPIRRRQIGDRNTLNNERNNRKAACRAGGAI